MRLSTLQIRQLIAEVFSKACVNEQVQIKEFTDALDTFKIAIENNRPLKCLDEIIWNRNLYGKEPYLPYMALFQKRYFEKLTEEIILAISAAYGQSTDEGFRIWRLAYADALISWKDYVYHTITNYNFPFTAEQQQEVDEYRKLNKLILENEWILAFPFFEKLAVDERFTNEHKSIFNLVLAEIIIYWKPEQDGIGYIEKAKELWPESEDMFITLGKYYTRKFEHEKGREVLFAAASRNKNKADVYSYIGDAYKDEQNYGTAHEWYTRAADTNFLSASVYSKIFSLGGEYAGKERINELVKLVEIIEQDDPVAPILYNTYRDASYQFSIVDNTKEAIGYLKKAIALKPELQAAKIDLAYEYFKAGNKTDAITTAIDVTTAEPFNYSAWLALSYFYETSGDLNKALDAYQKCIAVRPAEKAAIYNLIGSMFKNSEKWQEAMEYFKNAIEEKPLVTYYENLKSVHEKMNNDEQMIETTQQLAKHPDAINQYKYYNQLGIYFYQTQNYTEAVKYYQAAIGMKGEDSVLYENIGLNFEAAHELSKAEEAYQKAAFLEKEKGTYHNRVGYFYYTQAFKHDTEGKKQNYLSKAIEWYLKANEREPQNITYISNTALAYEKCNLFAEAANWYQKVLEIEPHNTNILLWAGFCSYKAGKYEGAITHFNFAIELEPWSVLLYDHLGYVYELQQNYAIAEETYRKALNAMDQYKEKVSADSLKADYFHNRIGVLLYNSGDYNKIQQSVNEYKKAIEVNPSVAVYHSNIAISYQHIADYENAIASYKHSIQLDPGNHDIYNSLGVVHYWQKQLPESIEAYSKAIQLKEGNLLYYENIGLSYFDLQQYSEAEVNWLKALELAPDDIICMQNLKKVYAATSQTDKELLIDEKINASQKPV
jgi:tetratricopeptide (TPR) repeat protein